MSEDTHAKIGTVESFRIGKGVSKENVDGTWLKEYVEITVKLPEGATGKDFLANFVGAEAMIDQLLEAPQTAAPAKTAPAQQPHGQVITMTPEEIDKLPWTASNWIRKDDPNRNARPMEDAWIKLENSDSRLIRMIEEAPDGKLCLPPYDFEVKRFQDSGAKLIVRRGPKGKKK